MKPQDLIVKFTYNSDDFELLDNFEEHLESALTAHGIGTYEGYELDGEIGSNGEFYMTTTNADLLFKTIKPMFLDASFLQVVKIILQTDTDGGEPRQIKEYQL